MFSLHIPWALFLDSIFAYIFFFSYVISRIFLLCQIVVYVKQCALLKIVDLVIIRELSFTILKIILKFKNQVRILFGIMINLFWEY